MNLDPSLSAIVTGGASGLGRATALALAARGVRVAIFDLNADSGEQTAEEIGGVWCEVDVTSDASVAAGFDKARALHGQERVLVNCAGIGYAIKTASRDRTSGAIVPHDIDRFVRTLSVNLVGSFRCITLSAAGMMTESALEGGERGVILNTASVAAEDGQVGQVAYAASKAGIVGMTLPLARDLAGEGIRVNTILPGIFETPMLMGAPEKVIESLGASVPFPKRLGRPEEYAALALSMVENGYLNGAAVRLDGAIRMAPR